MAKAEFNPEVSERFERSLAFPIMAISGDRPDSVVLGLIHPVAQGLGLEVVEMEIDWKRAQEFSDSSGFWSELTAATGPNQLVVLTHRGELPSEDQQIDFMHSLRVLRRAKGALLAFVVVSEEKIEYGPDETFRVANINLASLG